MQKTQNEKDNRRVLFMGYENFPNMDLNLSFVSVPERVEAKKMLLDRSRKQPHKKMKPSSKWVACRPIGETTRQL